MYNQGISRSGDILDLAAARDIVEKAGAWYAYGGAKIGQGREATKKYLEGNPKVMEEIAKKVVAAENEKET
jgi:recombination protein RecA